MGGGERHLADLANHLTGRGHDVHAAISPRSPLAKELSALPRGNISTIPLRNALDAASALELAHLINKKEIEIVHVHMARDYPLAAYAARRNRKSRLIITRHVMFPLSRLHGVTLSNVARVIAVSEAVASRLREQQLFSADRIVTVPNGININRFAEMRQKFDGGAFRRKLRLPATSRLVGTVGEINQLKGHEDFVRAAAKLAEQFPDLHFIIAGEDSSAQKEHLIALQQLMAELGLKERTHHFGWLDDIAELYCALNVFVSASHSESFGLAMAEAMASGTPVVATATDGASEIIEDGITGLLVPIGDADALAESVAGLLEDELRRVGLAEAARKSVSDRFSLERMVVATEQVYREALGPDGIANV